MKDFSKRRNIASTLQTECNVNYKLYHNSWFTWNESWKGTKAIWINWPLLEMSELFKCQSGLLQKHHVAWAEARGYTRTNRFPLIEKLLPTLVMESQKKQCCLGFSKKFLPFCNVHTSSFLKLIWKPWWKRSQFNSRSFLEGKI